MKLYTILLLSFFALMACENADETAAETTTATTATCSIAADGAVHKLETACFSGSEFEHLRLEGVTIPDSSTITIWIKTNASQTTGAKITLTGGAANDTLAWDYLANGAGNETNLTAVNTTANVSNSTLCIDLHFEENPIHAIAWQGTACDTTYTTIVGGSPFLNNDANGGDMTAATGDVYYQITNDVTISKITGKGAIFEE